MSGFAALRRFTRPDPPGERCELCGAGLPPEHDHLAEPAARRVVCACGPCALLFAQRQDGKFRRVPRRVERLAGLRLGDEQWAGLAVPVGLAFFLDSTAAGGVAAVYPSPAGPLETPVVADAWQSLVAAHPVLAGLEPDVEALLVNRVNGADEAYRCPIDRCYELIGLVRTHWRGMSGGDEVWREVEAFFARLRGVAGG